MDQINLAKFDLTKLAEQFAQARPFSHVVLDDFVRSDILENVYEEFDSENFDTWDKREHERIQVKWRSNWQDDTDVPPQTLNLIKYLNSGRFLRWLSQLTGISGLIPDPYLTGGGFNQINPGGTLAVHADGNWHDLMQVHRRLNVIVYMNKDWQDAWGGDFELWSRKKNNLPDRCEKRVRPDWNRCVIFKTDDFSFHGHPTPLACPADRCRRSLILYYYTNTRPSEELQHPDQHHRALFHDPVKIGANAHV